MCTADGHCDSCDNCWSCDDGIDGTCGQCQPQDMLAFCYPSYEDEICDEEAVDEVCRWLGFPVGAIVAIAVAGTCCGVCIFCYFAIKCCKSDDSDLPGVPGGGNKEGAPVAVACAPVMDMNHQQQNIQIMQPAIRSMVQPIGNQMVNPVGNQMGNLIGNPPSDRVRFWLTTAVGLPEYSAVIVQNGFDTMAIVGTMTKADLVGMGITKIGHQRKILEEVAKLNGGYAANGNAVQQMPANVPAQYAPPAMVGQVVQAAPVTAGGAPQPHQFAYYPAQNQ